MNLPSGCQQKIEVVLEAAAVEDDPQMSPRLHAALRDIADLGDDQQEQACAMLASKLDGIPSAIGAGFVAVMLGAAVERGIPAEIACESIRRLFIKWCRTVRTEPEDSGYADSPVDESVVEGLQLLGQALVAHLRRDPDAMHAARMDEAFVSELNRIEHLSLGAIWVKELISKRSGELLVIHISGKAGFRVAYRNISNCFHLFTLLQAVLSSEVPDGKGTDPDLLAAARSGKSGESADSAWWHYGRGDAPVRSLDSTIWGEGSPDEIPVVDGMQVILLWPPLLQHRGWDSSFFGPSIQSAPASVELLERLPPEEFSSWWHKLEIKDAVSPHSETICPDCLCHSPSGAYVCLNCGRPFPSREESSSLRNSIDASGLNCLGLIAVPATMVCSIGLAILSADSELSVPERMGMGIAALVFGALGWIAYKYCRRATISKHAND
jgi:hypothetical protein